MDVTCCLCGDGCAEHEFMFGEYDYCECCGRLVLRFIGRSLSKAECLEYHSKVQEQRNDSIRSLNDVLDMQNIKFGRRYL